MKPKQSQPASVLSERQLSSETDECDYVFLSLVCSCSQSGGGSEHRIHRMITTVQRDHKLKPDRKVWREELG